MSFILSRRYFGYPEPLTGPVAPPSAIVRSNTSRYKLRAVTHFSDICSGLNGSI